MQLVMIETKGNQRYIFSSPRLRDAIGASYLIARIGTTNGGEDSCQSEDWVKVEYDRLRSGAYPTYEQACVSRSSGKVILHVEDAGFAKELIAAVTRRVAAQAPGLDVIGAFLPVNKTLTGHDLWRIREQSERYSQSRPPAVARFAQMPFLTRGRDSALPASPRLAKFVDGESSQEGNGRHAPSELPDSETKKIECFGEAKDDRTTALALPSRVKRYYALRGRVDFLLNVAGHRSIDYQNLVRDLTKLEQNVQKLADTFEGKVHDEATVKPEERLSRVAVIHIDGNGIGALMQNLEGALKTFQDRCSDLELLRKQGLEETNPYAFHNFVKAINAALEKAITDACRKAYWMVARLQYPHDHERLKPEQIIHVVPVLLGGDDATVIANADYALPFTAEFLRAFEEATAADPLLSVVAEKGKFTAGAGIAIVRTAFPFHLAYDLAERLASQAKSIGKKKGLSTFSYHQLVDTTILDSKALVERYSQLACQAFIVSDGSDAATSSNEGDTREERIANWAEMVRKTALFTGLSAADGKSEAVAFPGTRAQRMRRLQALIAADKDEVEYGLPPIETGPDKRDGKKPSELLEIEWRAVQCGKESYEDLLASPPEADVTPKQVTPLMAMSTEIGSHEFFFDLINLKELLPTDYLRGELGLSSDENDAAGK